MVPRSLHRLWLTVILLTTLSMVLSSLSPFVAADPLRGDETGANLEQPRDSNATLEGSAPGASGEGATGGRDLSEDQSGVPGNGAEPSNEECLAEAREKIDDAQGGGVACDPRSGTATEEGSGDAGSAGNGIPPAGDVTCDAEQEVDCPPGNPPGDEPPKEDKPCDENQKEGCPPKEPPKGGEPCDPGQKLDCPPVGEQPPKEDSGPGKTGQTDGGVGTFSNLRQGDPGDPCDFDNKDPNDITCIRITVWKIWYNNAVQRPTGATITLTIAGQNHTVTCTHNTGQAICGTIDVVLDANTPIQVTESITGNPGPPFEWVADAGPGSYTFLGANVPIGTDPIAGNQPVSGWAGTGTVWDCLNPELFCGLKVYNRPRHRLLYLYKYWYPEPNPIPQIDLEVTLYDNQNNIVSGPTTYTCPQTNGALCAGPIVLPDDATKYEVQELNPPTGYSVSGTGQFVWWNNFFGPYYHTVYNSNWQPPPSQPFISIRIAKEWRNRWGLDPRDPGAPVTIEIDDGRTWNANCPMGGWSGPFSPTSVDCYELILPIDAIADGQQVTVSEVAPAGWTPVRPIGGTITWTWNSANPSAMSQSANGLSCSGSATTGIYCSLSFVNQQDVPRAYRLQLHVHKYWKAYDYWPLQPATIEATVGSQTGSIVCPRAWPGSYNLNEWIYCGYITFDNVTYLDTLQSFVERPPLPDWGYTHWGDHVITSCRWVTVPTEIRCDRWVENTPYVNVLRVRKRWSDPQGSGIAPVPATITVTLPNGATLQVTCTPPAGYDTNAAPPVVCGSRRVNVAMNDLLDVQEQISGDWGPVSGVGVIQVGGPDPALQCQQVQGRVECDLTVTNQAPLAFRIYVRKWWRTVDGQATSGPATTIQLVVDGQPIDVLCPAGSTPVTCATLEYPDAPPTLEAVREPMVPVGWLVQSGLGEGLNQVCNPYCTVDVVNAQEYRVRVSKSWTLADGSLAPATVVPGATLVVTINGQQQTVSCPANQPSGLCEELVLPGRPWQLVVTEPNPPAGWQPGGTGDYTDTCRWYTETCPIQIVNQYRGPHVVVQKRWMVGPWSYAPPPYPAVTLAVTIDGVTEDVNCPAQSTYGPVTCGVLFPTGAPGSINVSELEPPAPWQYDGYTVVGDCAQGCVLQVTNRRGRIMTINKRWQRGWYLIDPSEVPAVTLEVTLTYQNGQTAQHTLTCQAGANPSPCGQIVLDDTIASADFQEPGLGEGWTFEPPPWWELAGCYWWDCTVTVTNRDSSYPVYVSKQWIGDDGSLLDPAQTPGTTIEVTIDGTTYTFTCPGGVTNPVECGQVLLPSRPSSIEVTEPALGDEWVPVVPDVSWCLWRWAEECRIQITNRRNGPFTIRVSKYWVDPMWNPVSTDQIGSTTITVWVDGQAYDLTCAGGSNPDTCGEINLDRRPRRIVVDEPSVPSGWEVVSGTGDQSWCAMWGNSCEIWVVNRQMGTMLQVWKVWYDATWFPVPGPETYVQVTVDGVPLVLTCPETDSGWADCGSLTILGRPTSIRVDEPWLPEGWTLLRGAGDYSWCAGQGCSIWLYNQAGGKGGGGSSEELYAVDVRKGWLSDGLPTSDHPSTSLELTIEIEQGGQRQSVTLLLSCAANQASPQSCGSVTLTQRPDRVVVREPVVPDGWEAVAETVTVDNCPQQGPCVVTFTNQQNTGGSGGGGSGGSGGGGSGGSGGGGGGGTGSGGEDEPVVEEPPPPGTPENPTQGGGSGGPNQGVGQQPPAQQPAERAEATYQGQDWSIEDERLSEALRERKKIESEELQVIQLLPRTGRGVEAVLPASAVGLLVMATLLAGLALVWGSRARYRTAVGGAGERGAAGGAGRSGSDPGSPWRGQRHWSARGRGRPPVR
jgi:hypothetical protein